jgi:hypothetical protein
MFRKDGVVGWDVALEVGGRSAEQTGQPIGGHFHHRLFSLPEQVYVVEQCGQLIDSFSQTLVRPELVQQRDYVAEHEKLVPVPGVVVGLLQGLADLRKNLLGRLAEDEVEWGGAHAEI